MLLRYFYDRKLAQASYLVGCQQTGEAIVVDPARDVTPYLQAAESEGLRLVAAAETHIHADFLSGARELAEQVGARLFLSGMGGALWQYDYANDTRHTLLRDGDTFYVGNVRFDVWHTPGHTPEHLSFLLTDGAAADQPMGLFSGDFLFVGDVGRPDLLEKAAGVADTAVAGARQTFRSLIRLRELPDYLQVWPGHGAGSACGKALGAVPTSTIGYERRFNWALQEQDEDRFIRELLDGQPEPPRYFAVMKRLNRQGPPLLADRPAPARLGPDQLDAVLRERGPIVDVRPDEAFAAGHLPGTLNIPRGDAFIEWAGWLLAYDRPFYLLADEAAAAEVRRDLASIGLDNLAGIFDPAALSTWVAAGRALQAYTLLSAREAHDRLQDGDLIVVDVRGEDEWLAGHIPGARHIMLGYLTERLDEIPAGRPVALVCSSANRSAIGASILQAHGFAQVSNLRGGFDAWQAAGLPVARPT